MVTQRVSAYRALLREVTKSSIYPRTMRPTTVSHHIRAVFEGHRDDKDSDRFYHDMSNVAMFMSSQHMHKTLLERYNPLLGLSVEERVKKTAHRVGLDMPLGPKDEES